MKNKMRLLVLVLALLLAFAMPALADGKDAASVEELKAALADPYTSYIKITSDLTLGEKITVDRDVTIFGSAAITRDAAYTGTLIEVAAGAELTLEDVTIDGNNNWAFDREGFDQATADDTVCADGSFCTPEAGKPVATAYSIVVKGSMSCDGVTIKNHYGKSSCRVFNVVGDLTLDNTTITHCASTYEAVVAYVDTNGTLTINDGTLITDTYGCRNGVISRTAGTIVMNGGTISDTHAINSNGSVFMAYGANSRIEIHGGTITNNVGVQGPNNPYCSVIYLHSGSSMVMTDGVVSNNRGRTTGGILSRSNSKSLTVTGGLFKNNVAVNEATAHHSDVHVQDAAKVHFSGGHYDQYIPEEWIDEGYFDYTYQDGTNEIFPVGTVPTGDAADIALWSAMTLLGAFCIVLLARRKTARQN